MLNLIDHLPQTSYFAEALAEDEKLAADPALQSSQPHKERMRDWGPEREMQAHIYDRLGDIRTVLVALAGGKPSPSKPYPRPVTATQRLADRRANERNERLRDRLRPR